jgi:prepilin-type N-terminal cleavage/methylation domain-containing protein
MKLTNKKLDKMRQITSGVCGRYGATHQQMVGFTLVELLVVISIIALLLAVLMPALNKARNQSYRVVCRSQLHQVGVGILMYAQEHKNQLPIGNFYNYPISNYGDSSGNGIDHEKGIDDSFIALDVQPYLSTTDYTIFMCPANKAVARKPAYNFKKDPHGMTTYEWYKSGNLNLDSTKNYGYFIYYYYFGNYAYEGFNTSGTIREYLSYNELERKRKGLIYPTSSLGPRAKLMQDIATDSSTDITFKDAHIHPNGLYTDGSVISLTLDVKHDAHRRTPIGITHYW